MDKSDSLDLTMFDESMELRTMSRSSSMGFCQSEPDTDFDDVGFTDEPNLQLKINQISTKLLDLDDEMEDDIEFPEILSEFRPKYRENSNECKASADDSEDLSTKDIEAKEQNLSTLIQNECNITSFAAKKAPFKTISLADFQKAQESKPVALNLPKIDADIEDFGSDFGDNDEDWDLKPNTQSIQSPHSNGTLHSRRSSMNCANEIDSISNFGDDLDNISDLGDEVEKPTDPMIPFKSLADIADKLARLKETTNDNMMIESDVNLELNKPTLLIRKDVKISQNNTKNTIKLVKPVSKTAPSMKPTNSNFAKPPLKSNRLSGPTTKQSVEDKKDTPTSKKPTYKVVFGRTILIDQPKPKTKKVPSKPTLIRNLASCDQPKSILD